MMWPLSLRNLCYYRGQEPSQIMVVQERLEVVPLEGAASVQTTVGPPGGSGVPPVKHGFEFIGD